MTPTLMGRWQTRFLLLSTLGFAISVVIGIMRGDIRPPLTLLVYVFVLGLAWDALYQYIQTYRWERDWPQPFQVVAGIVEGVLLWIERPLVLLRGDGAGGSHGLGNGYGGCGGGDAQRFKQLSSVDTHCNPRWLFTGIG